MANIKKKTKRGFTLVEMLIVVMMIGILAAVAVPTYMKTVEKSRATQAISTLNEIARAQNVYNVKTGHFSGVFMPLPLEIKDKDGNDATEREFEDKYFSYMLNVPTRYSARAMREYKDEPYYLYIDYVTGNISCEPQRHQMCKTLELQSWKKLNCFLGPSSNGDILEYDSNCFSNYNYGGFHCEGNLCGEFSDGKLIGKWDFDTKSCQIYSAHSIAGASDTVMQGNQWLCVKGKMCVMDKQHPGQCLPETEPQDPESETTIECKIIKDKVQCSIIKDGKELGVCDAAEPQCFEKLGASGLVCSPKEGKCYTYQNGKVVDSCKANKEGTACVEMSVKCEAGKCSILEDGKEVGQCSVEEPQCFEKLGASGLVCDPKKGVCYNYQNGKLLGECKANKEGTACDETPQEAVITYKCNKNMCTIYKDGEAVAECGTWDSSCLGGYKINGLICDTKDNICYTFKDGQIVGVCDKAVPGCQEGTLNREHPSDGIACYEDDEYCYNYEKGQLLNWCRKNLLGNACLGANEELVCYKDKGVCVDYDGGKIVGECRINNTGTGCAKADDGMKDGVLCEKGTCYVYKNGEVVDQCKANLEGNDCAKPHGKRTMECVGTTCTIFEDGKKIGSCNYYQSDCLADYEVNGQVCDAKSTMCYTYENGKIKLNCQKISGICQNVETGLFCYSNANYSQCADGEAEMKEIYSVKCSADGECKYYEGIDGTVVASCKIGDQECYEKYNVSMFYCDKELCYTYKDGKLMDKCKVNAAGNGCNIEPICKPDDWDCICKGAKPQCFEDNGASGFFCFPEEGACYTFEKGKRVSECKINDAGTGCLEEKPKDGWVCDGGWTCAEYEKDKPTGRTCYYNGKDGCITGKGKERVCIGKECRTYIDGVFNKQ